MSWARTPRAASAMALVLLLAVASLLGACGGGGGGASPVVPGPQAAVATGIYQYSSVDPTQGGRVFVDSSGHMIGSICRDLDSVSFSGVATIDGDGRWTIPNALVATSAYPAVTSRTTTISGSVSGGVSLSVDIPDLVRPAAWPSTFTLSYGAGNWVHPASQANLTGRYSNYQLITGRGAVLETANFAIDSAGAIRGLVAPDCNAIGTAVVADPARNLYRGTVTLAGSGCPAGLGADVPILGGLQSIPGSEGRRAWFELVKPSGETFSVIAHGGVPSPYANIYQAVASSFNDASGIFLVDATGYIVGSMSNVGTDGITNEITFSGQAIFDTLQSSWSGPDMPLNVRRSSLDLGLVTSTASVTVTGTYSADTSFSISIPNPPRPASMPPTVTAGLLLSPTIVPTYASLVGRYTDTYRVGPSVLTRSDFTVDAAGRLAGMYRAGCTMEGTVALIDPSRKVITATLTLSGEACPAGFTAPQKFLGYSDPTTDITFYAVGPDGLAWFRGHKSMTTP